MWLENRGGVPVWSIKSPPCTLVTTLPSEADVYKLAISHQPQKCSSFKMSEVTLWFWIFWQWFPEMYTVLNSKAAMDTHTTHIGLQPRSHPSDSLWPLFVRSHTIWASRGHRAAGVVASTPSMTSACGMLHARPAYPAPWCPLCEGKNRSASMLLMSFCQTSLFILGAGFVCYRDAPSELLDFTLHHVTTVVTCKIVRNARQMNLVNVIIVTEAKLRWVTIAAILSLWGIPGGPQTDLMLSGASANYMSLSWVDLQWILWLEPPFLTAHGKT